jgi:uncharacterized membrane protein YqjE
MITLATLCLTFGRNTFDKVTAILVPWLLLAMAVAFGIWKWREARATDRAVAEGRATDVVRAGIPED